MAGKLADWYYDLKISIATEKLELRQSGVNEYVEEDFDYDCEEELLSLFFSNNPPEAAFERLASHFQKTDPTFSVKQKREMQMLAGAILYETLASRSLEEKLSIQLKFLMYLFLGNNGFVKDISKEIINSFYRDTAEYREKATENDKKENITALKTSFKVSEGNAIVYDEAVIEKLNTIVTKINKLTVAYNKAQDELEKKTNLVWDDTQILWWILGGYADKRNKKYAELSPAEAAYLAGCGLAKRITQYPGPYSADMILKHILENCKQAESLTIGDFIDSIDDTLVEAYNNETPLLMALQKKKEVGAGNWHKPLQNRFGLDVTREYSLPEIAYEVYIEKMYVDFMED